MGAYNLIVNTSVLIDLPTDFADSGWRISGGKATHGGCNAGIITLIDVGLLPLTSYVITYEVSAYVSGLVKVKAGGVDGLDRTANGIFSETVTTGADGSLQFYADGVLTLDYLDYYLLEGSEVDNSVTIAFNESEDKFVTHYSYKPEMMIKFSDGFFTCKNGELWEHNVNPIRNNFYGDQYTSKLRFVCNIDYKGNKLWSNLRLDSVGNWFSPSMITPDDDQFPNGMETRLKKGNFKSIDGKLWADILRDLNDPNFNTIVDADARKLKALLNGRKMQGCYLVIELECADTKLAKLSSVEVYYTDIPK